MLADIIIVAVLLVIVGSASAYIVKAKKSGKKCIGCPDGAGCCSSKGGKNGQECCCGCSNTAPSSEKSE